MKPPSARWTSDSANIVRAPGGANSPMPRSGDHHHAERRTARDGSRAGWYVVRIDPAMPAVTA